MKKSRQNLNFPMRKTVLAGLCLIAVCLLLRLFAQSNTSAVYNVNNDISVAKAVTSDDPALLSAYYPKFQSKQLNDEVQNTLATIKKEQCGDSQKRYVVSYERKTVLDEIVTIKFTCSVFGRANRLERTAIYTLNYDNMSKGRVSLTTLLNKNAVETIVNAQKQNNSEFGLDSLLLFSMEDDGILFYANDQNGENFKVPYNEVKKDIILPNKHFGNMKTTTYRVEKNPDVDNNKKLLAFTFDDGPSEKNTARILKAFEKNGGKATFFMVGSQVEKFPQIAKNVYEQGHEIGNHTYYHKRLTDISDKKIRREVSKTQDIIYKATGGAVPRVLRPPYGAYDKNVKKVANMPLALWDVDTNDWKFRDKEKIVKHILKHAKDGSVILLHDLYDTSADAIEEVLPLLREKGFEFVTLSQLEAHRSKKTQ